MRKLIIALLFPLGALCQDTTKADTVKAKLWRVEGKSFHRAVDGYVILQPGKKPEYLTLRRVPFASKYRIEDYYVVCK